MLTIRVICARGSTEVRRRADPRAPHGAWTAGAAALNGRPGRHGARANIRAPIVRAPVAVRPRRTRWRPAGDLLLGLGEELSFRCDQTSCDVEAAYRIRAKEAVKHRAGVRAATGVAAGRARRHGESRPSRSAARPTRLPRTTSVRIARARQAPFGDRPGALLGGVRRGLRTCSSATSSRWAPRIRPCSSAGAASSTIPLRAVAARRMEARRGVSASTAEVVNPAAAAVLVAAALLDAALRRFPRGRSAQSRRAGAARPGITSGVPDSRSDSARLWCEIGDDDLVPVP